MKKNRIKTHFSGLSDKGRRERAEASLKGLEDMDLGKDLDKDLEGLKAKLVQTLMSAPLSMASAGLGGVLIENSIGKTPSFIFGAFATYMGYLTGLKPLSALGLGMVTASYYSHRLENSAKQTEENVEGVFQTEANYEASEPPSQDLFFDTSVNGNFNDDLSSVEDGELNEQDELRKNPWTNQKNLLKYFRKKPSLGDIDDEDIAGKLY